MHYKEGTYHFVSDVHLGASDPGAPERERAFVEYLRSLPSDTAGLFLLGDIFDFWVEYKNLVPRGYTRVFGELARLADAGCHIWFFKGNHDWWTTDYFEKEFGAEVVSEPSRIVELGSMKVCVGHGDAYARDSFGKKLIYCLFRNRALIALLRSLPPRLIFAFARKWSARSRRGNKAYVYDVENSALRDFALKLQREKGVDCFVFGHFHKCSVTPLEGDGKLYLLDCWEDSNNALYLSGTIMCGIGFPNIQK